MAKSPANNLKVEPKQKAKEPTEKNTSKGELGTTYNPVLTSRPHIASQRRSGSSEARKSCAVSKTNHHKHSACREQRRFHFTSFIRVEPFRTVLPQRSARDPQWHQASTTRFPYLTCRAKRDHTFLGLVTADGSTQSCHALRSSWWGGLLQRQPPPPRRVPHAKRIVLEDWSDPRWRWLHVSRSESNVSSPIQPTGRRQRNTKYTRLSPNSHVRRSCSKAERGGQKE
jgi:hypothetical protein